MGDVLKFTRKKPAEKARGRIMCANNHHKWKVQTERKFDVKQGRLVTEYRCARCGKTKTALH
jgi:hypothetical protein